MGCDVRMHSLIGGKIHPYWAAQFQRKALRSVTMRRDFVGVFDSGYGGLTVLRALIHKFPHEDFVYFGDNAHAPYGSRSVADVQRLAFISLDMLAQAGAKALVVACNTACAAALPHIIERYQVGMHIPVVDVVAPTARALASVTTSGTVGVIATDVTIRQHTYQDALKALNPHLSITAVACPEFVPLIEAGRIAGSDVDSIVARSLSPIAAAHVDSLALGCTHYPLLIDAIAGFVGDGVRIVDASPTAQVLRDVLGEHALLAEERNQGVTTFVTSADPTEFRARAQAFLGLDVPPVYSSLYFAATCVDRENE